MGSFGGGWTSRKLGYLEEYLRTYLTALKNQYFFNTIYIDAFAGSGSWGRTNDAAGQESLLSFAEGESEGFVEGSAIRAVKLSPGFDRYCFIEMDNNRLSELKKKIPESVHDKCHFHHGEANKVLLNLCANTDWSRTRAVVFLDPYGMQVPWSTIVEISKTKAIDLWWLFPLGQGVNRLLRRDGQISDTNRDKLNEIFGADDWYEQFYEPSKQTSFLDDSEAVNKTATFDSLSEYVHRRLSGVFPYAHKPKALCNSKNVPLFLLCFAMANDSPKAMGLAKRLVNSIMEK